MAESKIVAGQLQSSATSRVLGRISAGAGDVEELTGANLNTLTVTIPDTTLGSGMSDHLTILPFGYSSLTQGTFSSWSGSTSSYFGGITYNATNGNGDRVNYLFSTSAGTYTFRLIVVLNSDRAIHQVLLDGTQIGSQDCYNGGTVWNSFFDITGVSCTAGNHTLSLKANGKNGSSSGYIISIAAIHIWRTA